MQLGLLQVPCAYYPVQCLVLVRLKDLPLAVTTTQATTVKALEYYASAAAFLAAYAACVDVEAVLTRCCVGNRVCYCVEATVLMLAHIHLAAHLHQHLLRMVC